MQIALYGLAYWQELQPTRLPEDTYWELQLLARQCYQMTSILIKAKVDFNAICDQVLPGMQELMKDHAGRHKNNIYLPIWVVGTMKFYRLASGFPTKSGSLLPKNGGANSRH